MRILARALASLLVLGLAQYVVAGQVREPRIIALSGDQASGLPDDVDFLSFHNPSINNIGEVAFKSILDGPGINSVNRTSIWQESAGILSLVARRGDPAPRTDPESEYEALSKAIRTDTGITAFQSSLTGTITGACCTRYGAFLHQAGTTVNLSQTGDRSNTIGLIRSFDNLAVNDAGTIVVSGSVGSGLRDAIWRQSGSAIDKIILAREPSGLDGRPFTPFLNMRPLINNEGTVIFTANVDDNRSSGHDGLWMYHEHNLELVTGRGQSVPGSDGNLVISGVDRSAILNASGDVAIPISVTGDDYLGEAIWTRIGGHDGIAMLTGDAAPGTVASFSQLLSFRMNNESEIVFGARLDGPLVDFDNDIGLWRYTEGEPTLVLRKGDAAPDTEDGVVFGQIFSGFQLRPTLNDQGRLVTSVELAGSGIDDSNNLAIYVQDRDDRLRLILREGDQLQVGPDDLRTIAAIQFAAGTASETGTMRSYSNEGELIYIAEFTDGSSGVFVSASTVVPEPSCTWFLIAGFIAFCRSRRTS